MKLLVVILITLLASSQAFLLDSTLSEESYLDTENVQLILDIDIGYDNQAIPQRKNITERLYDLGIGPALLRLETARKVPKGLTPELPHVKKTKQQGRSVFYTFEFTLTQGEDFYNCEFVMQHITNKNAAIFRGAKFNYRVVLGLWPSLGTPVAITFKDNYSHDDSKIILNNNTLAERVYKAIMDKEEVPNVYYKSRSHILNAVTIGPAAIGYSFDTVYQFGSGLIKTYPAAGNFTPNYLHKDIIVIHTPSVWGKENPVPVPDGTYKDTEWVGDKNKFKNFTQDGNVITSLRTQLAGEVLHKIADKDAKVKSTRIVRVKVDDSGPEFTFEIVTVGSAEKTSIAVAEVGKARGKVTVKSITTK